MYCTLRIHYNIIGPISSLERLFCHSGIQNRFLRFKNDGNGTETKYFFLTTTFTAVLPAVYNARFSGVPINYYLNI